MREQDTSAGSIVVQIATLLAVTLVAIASTVWWLNGRQAGRPPAPVTSPVSVGSPAAPPLSAPPPPAAKPPVAPPPEDLGASRF